MTIKFQNILSPDVSIIKTDLFQMAHIDPKHGAVWIKKYHNKVKLCQLNAMLNLCSAILHNVTIACWRF